MLCSIISMMLDVYFPYYFLQFLAAAKSITGVDIDAKVSLILQKMQHKVVELIELKRPLQRQFEEYMSKIPSDIEQTEGQCFTFLMLSIMEKLK